MKRIIMITLAILFLLFAVGCDVETDPATTPAPQTTKPAPQTTAPVEVQTTQPETSDTESTDAPNTLGLTFDDAVFQMLFDNLECSRDFALEDVVTLCIWRYYDYTGPPNPPDIYMLEVSLADGGLFWGRCRREDSGIVSSMEDIRRFPNLRFLELSGAKLDNIEALSACPSLIHLTLRYAEITDISLVGELINLEHLTLSGNPIEDFTPLSGLESLTYLDLGETPISDVRPLLSLKKLESLYLWQTYIKDISALNTLKQLKLLDVKYTPVKKFGWLAAREDFELRLGYNDQEIVYLTDTENEKMIRFWFDDLFGDVTSGYDFMIHPLFKSHFDEIVSIEIARYYDDTLDKRWHRTAINGEWGFGTGELTTLLDFDAFSNLETLVIYDSDISDLSPLLKLKKLKHLILFNSKVYDASILAPLKLETLLIEEYPGIYQ